MRGSIPVQLAAQTMKVIRKRPIPTLKTNYSNDDFSDGYDYESTKNEIETEDVVDGSDRKEFFIGGLTYSPFKPNRFGVATEPRENNESSNFEIENNQGTMYGHSRKRITPRQLYRM